MSRAPTLRDQLLSRDQLGALLDVAEGPLKKVEGGWLTDQDHDGVPVLTTTLLALERRGLVERIGKDRRTGALLPLDQHEWRITPAGLNYRDEVVS